MLDACDAGANTVVAAFRTLRFGLPAFPGTLPKIVNLTIRRHPDDSYAGDVALAALRLSYQASR